MSISNLLANGRQSDLNVHSNSLVLAPILSAERNAFAPSVDGRVCYDAEVGSLFIRESGQWDKVQTTPASGPVVAQFGPTAAVEVPVGGSGNICNAFTANNTTATILSGGASASTAGILTVPRTGYYRVYAQMYYDSAVAPTSTGAISVQVRDGAGATVYFMGQNSKFAGGDTTARQQMLSTYGIVYLTAGQTLMLYVSNTISTVGAKLNVGAIGAGPLGTYMTVDAI